MNQGDILLENDAALQLRGKPQMSTLGFGYYHKARGSHVQTMNDARPCTALYL